MNRSVVVVVGAVRRGASTTPGMWIGLLLGMITLIVILSAVSALNVGQNGLGGGGSADRDGWTEVERAHEGASARLREGDSAGAEAIALAALERHPDAQKLHLVLSEALSDQQRWGEAVSSLERAIELGPDSAEYRFLLGNLRWQLGDVRGAAEAYAAGERLAPENPKHALYLAQALRKTGRGAEAKAALERVVELDEGVVQAWVTLAGIALDVGDAEEALVKVGRARALEPEVTAWRLLESRALVELGRHERAATMLLAGGVPDRENEAAHWVSLLTVSLGAFGQEDELRAAVERAAAAHPGSGIVLMRAAEACAAGGDAEQAWTFAERALSLGHEPARGLMESLVE